MNKMTKSQNTGNSKLKSNFTPKAFSYTINDPSSMVEIIAIAYKAYLDKEIMLKIVSIRVDGIEISEALKLFETNIYESEVFNDLIVKATYALDLSEEFWEEKLNIKPIKLQLNCEFKTLTVNVREDLVLVLKYSSYLLSTKDSSQKVYFNNLEEVWANNNLIISKIGDLPYLKGKDIQTGKQEWPFDFEEALEFWKEMESLEQETDFKVNTIFDSNQTINIKDLSAGESITKTIDNFLELI